MAKPTIIFEGHTIEVNTRFRPNDSISDGVKIFLGIHRPCGGDVYFIVKRQKRVITVFCNHFVSSECDLGRELPILPGVDVSTFGSISHELEFVRPNGAK